MESVTVIVSEWVLYQFSKVQRNIPFFEKGDFGPRPFLKIWYGRDARSMHAPMVSSFDCLLRAGLFAPLCNNLNSIVAPPFATTLHSSIHFACYFRIWLGVKRNIQFSRHPVLKCPSLSKRPLITTQRIRSSTNGWSIATLAMTLIMNGSEKFGHVNTLVLENKLWFGIKGISSQRMYFVGQ